MQKKIFLKILISILIFVIPLVYATNYGTGIYGAGKYNIGETPTEQVPGAGGGGASGVSKITITPECLKDSECNVEEGEVCWDNKCTKLFDIEIIDFESPAKLGDFFDFTYFIKGMANISGDVKIEFWIEKNRDIITSGSDVIYLGSFEERTKKTKLFLPSETRSGVYKFVIKVSFENYAVKSHRTIEIITSEEGIAIIKPVPEISFKEYVIIGLIFFISTI